MFWEGAAREAGRLGLDRRESGQRAACTLDIPFLSHPFRGVGSDKCRRARPRAEGYGLRAALCDLSASLISAAVHNPYCSEVRGYQSWCGPRHAAPRHATPRHATPALPRPANVWRGAHREIAKPQDPVPPHSSPRSPFALSPTAQRNIGRVSPPPFPPSGARLTDFSSKSLARQGIYRVLFA